MIEKTKYNLDSFEDSFFKESKERKKKDLYIFADLPSRITSLVASAKHFLWKPSEAIEKRNYGDPFSKSDVNRFLSLAYDFRTFIDLFM